MTIRPPGDGDGLEDRLARVRGRVRQQAAALEAMVHRHKLTADAATAAVDRSREKRREARAHLGPPRQRPGR